MGKSFGWKLSAAFLVTIALLLLLLSGFGYAEFKKYYLNNLEVRLTREAYLVSDMTRYRSAEGNTVRSYQDICIIAARDSLTRVTIIDGDGTVLGDSEVAPEQLDNHSSRPEVYTALHGGIGVEIRYSDTLGVNMLYVAVPFNNGDKSGAVRMAMPMSDLQAIYTNTLIWILGTALVCGLLAVLLSFILVRYFSRPIKEITAAVQDMAKGNLRRRISLHNNDETGILAHAFNEMGQHIEEKVRQISEVKNRLEVILHTTVNGIMLIDGDQRLVYANPSANELLGLGENFIGRKYAEMVTAYEILAMLDEARSSGQPVKQLVVLYTRGERTIEANVVPVFNQESVTGDILVVLNDVTEMKRLEKVRKDFVANVSHELKTPVTAISGFAETLLENSGKDPDSAAEFTRIIYDEAQRLALLINSLLTLSRLESENVHLNIQAVELKSLIRDTINRMSKLAVLKNITIDYKPPAETVEINSDPELIDPVLINLLDNAIKYSPAGSQVEVGLENLSDQVIITVKDHGIGIPVAEVPRIFERFYRVDKARSRKTGGSGLGLAIVKHLVENLNGQVAVTSTLGHGSTFSVTLFK